MATTYSVKNMRIVKPSGKVADKNPDRALTIHGEFRQHLADGKLSDPLSIASKAISRETVLSPEFALDPVAGTLTIPSGERGRKASAGMSADSLAEYLAEIAASVTADDAEVTAAAE